jgi:hypothetical protein
MSTTDPVANPNEAFAKRVDHFRRVLAKGAGKTPPSMLRLEIRSAAALCAEEERCVNDERCDPAVKVRVASAARRARAILAASIAAGQQSRRASAPHRFRSVDEIMGGPHTPDSLEEYAAAKAREKAASND